MSRPGMPPLPDEAPAASPARGGATRQVRRGAEAARLPVALVLRFVAGVAAVIGSRRLRDQLALPVVVAALLARRAGLSREELLHLVGFFYDATEP